MENHIEKLEEKYTVYTIQENTITHSNKNTLEQTPVTEPPVSKDTTNSNSYSENTTHSETTKMPLSVETCPYCYSPENGYHHRYTFEKSCVKCGEMVPANKCHYCLTSGNTTEEERAAAKICTVCGEERTRRHYSPIESAPCRHCGEMVEGGTCHDCG